jgi:His-Xaa-Ser system protein HxsD
MQTFLKTEQDGNRVEFLVDTNIFSLSSILKASYMFLDVAYFFFRKDEQGNVVVQVTRKGDTGIAPESLIRDYSDELLATVLRENLERDNKEIRETIVKTALGGYADVRGHTSVNTNQYSQNLIDFDKDIDEILKEIESDPDLQIDQAEIDAVLKEIESSESKRKNGSVTIDPNKVKDAKAKF